MTFLISISLSAPRADSKELRFRVTACPASCVDCAGKTCRRVEHTPFNRPDWTQKHRSDQGRSGAATRHLRLSRWRPYRHEHARVLVARRSVAPLAPRRSGAHYKIHVSTPPVMGLRNPPLDCWCSPPSHPGRRCRSCACVALCWNGPLWLDALKCRPRRITRRDSIGTRV